jgi:hypothetical protein
MKYKNIFTEYDESLERTLNLDPLGLSIIWTQFGQRIFKGKISSATWDVRSFNINLFNHFVIKNLMEKGNDEIKNHFEKDKKGTIEKFIIVLENMLIWSWYQDKDGWDRKNLLGTSKAISLWDNNNNNKININITNSLSNLELLKKQKTTGVNGSYKGSFISMGFFDSNYNDYFDDREVFNEVNKVILGNDKFKELFDKVMEFFTTMEINKIPTEAYKNAFAKTSILSEYTKDFWETRLGFRDEEAGDLYANHSLNDEASTRVIFQNLAQKGENFNLIVELEPKLSYLDAIFNYLLFCDSQKIEELEKKEFFEDLKDLDFAEEEKLSKDGTKERLNLLQKVRDIESLIEFHKEVMEARGYASWLKIENDKLIVDVKSKEEKEKLEEKLEIVVERGLENTPWLHSYYLGSIRSIKKGFNDEAL